MKISKPTSCEKCPVVKTDKNKIYCGCDKNSQADKNSSFEKQKMWEKCPLEWD